MARYSRSSPLALMVLCTLWEQPTHPYQVLQTLMQRHKDRSAKLNYGSLYTVIASLEKAGLIEAVAVTREGNLPNRTTYRVTDAGADELMSWLADLFAHPREEFPAYMAALSLMPALPPDQVVALLDERIAALSATVAELDEEYAKTTAYLPALLSIEQRYLAAMTRAELEFTQKLADAIRTGELPGIELWRAIHETATDGRPNSPAVAEALRKAGVDEAAIIADLSAKRTRQGQASAHRRQQQEQRQEHHLQHQEQQKQHQEQQKQQKRR